MTIADARGKVHHRFNCLLHQLRIEDLRTDVRVIPDQTQPLRSAHPLRRFVGLAIPDGESEFGIGGTRAHLGVGVGIDTGVQSQHDLNNTILLPRDLVEPRNLQVVVDRDEPDAGRDGLAQFLPALVVAVEHHFPWLDAGNHPRVQLPAGHHVEPHSLLGQDAHQRRGEIGLSGIKHFRARVGTFERGSHRPRPLAQGPLVEDIERRAEGGSQLGRGDAANFDRSRTVALGC